MLKSYFKKNAYLLLIGLLSFFVMTGTACAPKTGCPINENATVKTNRKGELSKKSGRSQLFPKTMRKKMKKK